ncbi:lysophospholipid acyltransferase family protein [Salinicola aestuarinus]|uniref:lysophospholipid acyltransferase family protein n=1 Tax=Salinicola aestuarinus TaxID=1949082 RepID=UPI000DA17D18|nr:lysophospholipid acyltransferase family protein [Salinicola aestuarinus]
MKAIRTLLFYAGYFLAIFVSGLLMLPIGLMLPLRARFKLFNCHNRFIMKWLSLTCAIRYRIQGRENVPEGPCVVLANHQSEWETVFLQLLKTPICTVLKKELLSIPLFGWGVRLLKPIPLDRSRPSNAMRQVLSHGKQRLEEGLSVLIFPEGTRVAPGERRRFNKSGIVIACRAGVPVLPVAHNAGEHWGRHWIKQPGTLNVVVGEPIETTGRKPEAILEEVERWIEQTLGEISDVPRPPLPEKAPAARAPS